MPQRAVVRVPNHRWLARIIQSRRSSARAVCFSLVRFKLGPPISCSNGRKITNNSRVAVRFLVSESIILVVTGVLYIVIRSNWKYSHIDITFIIASEMEGDGSYSSSTSCRRTDEMPSVATWFLREFLWKSKYFLLLFKHITA